MKLRILFFIGLFVVSGYAQSATYFNTAKIKTFSVMSSANASFEDSFTLENFTAAGPCLVENGYVLIRVRDDARGQKQFSLLMAAKLADRAVTVKLRDDRVDAYGACYLDVLTMD